MTRQTRVPQSRGPLGVDVAADVLGAVVAVVAGLVAGFMDADLAAGPTSPPSASGSGWTRHPCEGAVQEPRFLYGNLLRASG